MKVVENVLQLTGEQNFLCHSCGKQLQYVYQKAGRQPEVKRLVLHMLVRNCDIREIEEVAGVHRQTVLRWLTNRLKDSQTNLVWK